MLNLCLALASLAGSAWMARTAGSQAYVAGGVAMLVVGVAASLALLLSFLQSLQASHGQAANNQAANNNAVSAVMLGMLIRMGLPLAAMVMMQQTKSPLIGAGFMGLLVLNYLVALPVETLMSLQFVRKSDAKVPTQPSIDKLSSSIDN